MIIVRIVSKDLINMVADFDVLSRPESCHLPIYFEFKKPNKSLKNENSNDRTDTFYASSELYNETIGNHALEGKFDVLENMIGDNEKNINTVLETF